MTGWIDRAVAGVRAWEQEFGAFAPHPSLHVSDERFGVVIDDLVARLQDNYPFFHPRYAGQMLKPPHPAAIAAYAATMHINPNAHALDGGPATARLEKEVVADLAAMFGFTEHLGHLTSSGTIANLEALFVARETHPGKAVAFSEEAHYTHSRMCGLLGVEAIPVPSDDRARMDPDALAALLASGRVGTVVATAGTTGPGSVDQIQDIVPLARAHGVRVHVDAAYGGFFTLIAGDLVAPEPWLAIADVDSIVVDPHKHGLQPYGCGAVIFADPEVGRHFVHDSPYTYFTSDELHLGEISLECSRPGAAAAALWTTLQLLPLTANGLGAVLAACRRAARDIERRIDASPRLAIHQPAEIDIVTYFDRRATTTSEVDAASARVLAAGMKAEDPVFLSTLSVPGRAFARRHPHVTVDSDRVRVLRSVLLKPEHEESAAWLVDRLEDLITS